METGRKRMNQVYVWHDTEKNIFTRKDGKNQKEKKLVFDDRYREIGEEALKNNIRITEAEFGKTLKIIGKKSFLNCTALRKITLEKAEKIYGGAFGGCVNLKEIYFPPAFEYLGKRAFCECKRLKKIQFDKDSSITAIPDQAFYRCGNLTEITFPQNLKSIGKESFCQTGIQNLELPDSLRIIDNNAFAKCSHLESVIIPQSVKWIGSSAFRGCNRLKTIEIHGDVQKIGEQIANRNVIIRCKEGSSVDEYCRQNGYITEYA